MADHTITLTAEEEQLITNETGKTVEEYMLEVITNTVNSTKNRNVKVEFDRLSYADKKKALDLLRAAPP